jgi:HSP20 family protein
MAGLVRWDPFDKLSLRDAMDRLFEDAFITPRWFAPLRESLTESLALDVIENDNDIVVKASIPGFKPEDIDVSVADDTLTIKGETKVEKKEGKENYILQERRYGTVHRTLRLPTLVQADKAKAEFEHGVLTLTLPKAELVKGKPIKVTVNSNG